MVLYHIILYNIYIIQYKHKIPYFNNSILFIVGVARINLNNVLRAYAITRMIRVTETVLNK